MPVVRYLTSHWIRRVVHEFQSPHFRSETMLQFEILLLAGVALSILLTLALKETGQAARVPVQTMETV